PSFGRRRLHRRRRRPPGRRRRRKEVGFSEIYAKRWFFWSAGALLPLFLIQPIRERPSGSSAPAEQLPPPSLSAWVAHASGATLSRAMNNLRHVFSTAILLF